MQNISTINPSELAEELRLAWERWAKLDGEANLLKEKAKRIHAQTMISCGDIPASKAKMQADVSDAYNNATEAWINKETEANIAKGYREALAVRIDLTRSLEASKRAELSRLG